MNAKFNQISSSDAAKTLGVDRTTVTGWCKRGIINYIDVSEPNSTVARYVLSEEEVDRIKRSMKKWGMRSWTRHYNKNYSSKAKKNKEIIDDSHIFESKPVETTITNSIQAGNNSSTKDESEKIANTIMYIKDIKERLNDLEAEKAQLLNELEELRQEVMAYI